MYNIRKLLLFLYLYSKHREYILSEPNSVQMIDARAAKLSDYIYPVTKRFK